MVASTFIFNPVIALLLVLFAVVAFTRALRFRRATGRNPWGIHPVVWFALGLIFGLLGSLLCLVAIITSTPRSPSPEGAVPRGGRSRSDLTAGTRATPIADGEPPIGSALPVVALPGWQPDPSGRHQHRYWSGASWTDYVSDNGIATIDPPG